MFAVLLAVLPGCAAIQMRIARDYNPEERRLRTLSASSAALPGAGASVGEQMEACVESARLAWPGVLRGDEDSVLAYRAALRRLIRLQSGRDWKVPHGVVAVREGAGVLDPAAADEVLPADQVRIRGVPHRVVEDGLGLACVAWFRKGSDFLADEPGVPPTGIAIPVTALMTFRRDGSAQWRFVRTLERDTWTVDGRPRKLAADYSVPMAMMIAKGINRSIDLVSLFRPQVHLHRTGLYQLQPFDPGKTPVVFVHGLMSRPETWRRTVNQLLEDPEIRRRCQLWFYLYPTGLPVWISAAGLRSELDRFNCELATRTVTAGDRERLQRKVLVGHSMGGLVSSLQVRQGGDLLWSQVSTVPMQELPVPESVRHTLRELLVFAPRKDVSRVIFAGVPHRGSPLALRPASAFFASQIRFTLPEIQRYRPLLLAGAHANVRRDLAAPVNSIRFLRENSSLLAAILALPRDERIPLHSIIGDRGRNNAPGGGDGIVPFRSAHYPGARSEKIVPSGHDVHQHPEGVREIARILHEELRR